MTNDYPVYIKWKKITAYMLHICARFPKSMRFNLANRLTNLTLDVLEGIIEAIYAKNKSHILHGLNVYIEKIRSLLQITVEERFISLKQYEFISREIDETGKMLGGWIKQCKE